LDRPGSLERGDVERLVALDQIVGSHTVSHPQLPTLTDADLAFELADSRRQLEDLSGRAVTWFAPPGGHYDGRTLPAAREVGYRYIRTMDWGYAPTLEASGVDRLLSTVPILRNTSERRLEAILEGHAKFPGFALKQLARRLLPPEAYARLRKLTIQSQS
jgi:peptidoglycan/xylan/chitin deacetylase (PgdA/CDA1 family)